ncbi:sulfatase, partial [Helicobacter sp. MIT 21-1697]|nr:sulfatase [Helicobacter sp. MIT 21-1697]
MQFKQIKNLFPNPFCDSRFFHAFCVLFVLNFIVLFFSHYFSLQTRFDVYYFVTFAYRIMMFCLSYISLFCLIYWLRVNILRNFLLAFVLFMSAICYVVEIFLLYNFSTPLNSYLITIALETNAQESVEFLQTYVSIGLCGIYALTLCGIWVIYKLKTPSKLHSLKWVYSTLLIVIVGIHITHLRPSSPTLRYSDMPYHAFSAAQRAYKGTLA